MEIKEWNLQTRGHDLEYCVLQDKDLLSHIIDEFVYTLDDKQVKEYEAEVNKILGE